MSKHILCIVGRSGSGKTSLALHLRKHIPFVSSRTTRQAREGEVSGEAPYHHFLSIDDYIKDMTTSGMVISGDLSRGDDIILADTAFGDSTYWTKVSDVIPDDDNPIIGYIIDPEGVANLHEAIEKVGYIICNNEYNKYQAPHLYRLQVAKISVLYIDAVPEVYALTDSTRRSRDDAQDLGWRCCEALSAFRVRTRYIPDLKEREEYMEIFTEKLARRIKHKLLGE